MKIRLVKDQNTEAGPAVKASTKQTKEMLYRGKNELLNNFENSYPLLRQLGKTTAE